MDRLRRGSTEATRLLSELEGSALSQAALRIQQRWRFYCSKQEVLHLRQRKAALLIFYSLKEHATAFRKPSLSTARAYVASYLPRDPKTDRIYRLFQRAPFSYWYSAFDQVSASVGLCACPIQPIALASRLLSRPTGIHPMPSSIHAPPIPPCRHEISQLAMYPFRRALCHLRGLAHFQFPWPGGSPFRSPDAPHTRQRGAPAHFALRDGPSLYPDGHGGLCVAGRAPPRA